MKLFSTARIFCIAAIFWITAMFSGKVLSEVSKNSQATEAYSDSQGSKGCKSCSLEQKPPPETAFVQLNEFLQNRAACNRDASLAAEAKKKYQESFPENGKTEEREIAGFKLRGQPEELSAAAATLNGVLPRQWNAAASQCQTVLCALTALFNSEEAAQRVMSFHKDTHYAISVDQNENASRPGLQQLWSLEEIRTIDMTVRQFPSNFLRMPQLKAFKRVADGISCLAFHYTGCGASASYNGIIRIFQNATQDSSYFRFAVAHELGHEFDFQNKITVDDRFAFRRSSFTDLSGWEKAGVETNPTLNTSNAGFTSQVSAKFLGDSSKTQPVEDFADCIGYYLFNPSEFKSKAPEKYQYLKQHFFGNLEYKDSDIIKDLFDKISGNKKVQNQCFTKLDEIKVDRDGNVGLKSNYGTIYFSRSKDYEINSISYFLAADTRCLQPIVEEILSLYPSNQQSCPEKIKKDKKDVESWILMQHAEHIKETIKDLLNTNASKATNECIQQKNLSEQCLKANLSKGVTDPQHLFFADKMNLIDGIDVRKNINATLLIAQALARSKDLPLSENLRTSNISAEILSQAPIIKTLKDKISEYFNKTPPADLTKLQSKTYHYLLLELSSFRQNVVEPYEITSKRCNPRNDECLIGKMGERISFYFASQGIQDTLSQDDLKSLVRKVEQKWK